MAIRCLLVAVIGFSRILRLEIKHDIQNVELAGNACTLCGIPNRLFESTKLFCSGSCGMQLIPRNASFYTDRSKQNCWCKLCYGRVVDSETLYLDDGTEITKRDLQSAKNDAVQEESWVQCDDCKCWAHQICALFNGRKNKTSSAYSCPKCTMKHKNNGEKPTKLMKTAEDLPRCKTSDFIEAGLKKTLEDAYQEKARNLGVGLDQIEKAEGLTVRVVSHIEKKHVVRDLVSRQMPLHYWNCVETDPALISRQLFFISFADA
jgi:E1A/CREB-binding protein